MTIAAFVLFVALAGVLSWGVRQCDTAKTATQKADSLLLENAVVVGNLAVCGKEKSECESRALGSRLRGQTIVAGIEKEIKAVAVRVNKMTPTQKRVAATKGLVSTKILPATALADTTTATPSIDAGESTDDALTRLTQWYEVYRDSTTAIANALATCELENVRLSGSISLYNGIAIGVSRDFDDAMERSCFLGIGRRKQLRQLKRNVISRLPK